MLERGDSVIYPNRIHEVRTDKDIKITQKELADSVGVTQPMISDYEAGISVPSVIVAELIARYLDTTIQYLFEDGIEAYKAEMGLNTR